MGIRGSLLAWLSAYLSHRVFRVRVGDKFSNFAQISSGIPQGSVVGPLLFIIYVADIPCCIKSQSSLFADDTKLFDNPVTGSDTLQNDFCLIVWCEDCVVLHLGKNNPQLHCSINNQSLKAVESHVDLGVSITSNLSWPLISLRYVIKPDLSYPFCPKFLQMHHPLLSLSCLKLIHKTEL